MFFANIPLHRMPSIFVLLIIVVISSPIFIQSSPDENTKNRLYSNFMEVLKPYLAKYEVRNGYQLKELSFASVANVLSMLEREFLPKALLEKCVDQHGKATAASTDGHVASFSSSMSLSMFLSQTNNPDLVAILSEMDAKFWRMAVPSESKLIEVAKSADGHRQLLSWLFSFAVRMGYTVGNRALMDPEAIRDKGVEQALHQIGLKNFVIALNCLRLPVSAQHLPMTFVALEEENKLSIRFQADARYQGKFEHNFKTLSFLLERERQPIHEILEEIRQIKERKLTDNLGYPIVRDDPKRPMDWLVQNWIGGTLHHGKWIDKEFDEAIMFMYMLKRHGHGLAQRLIESKQLEWYFRFFPGAKDKLAEWIPALKEHMINCRNYMSVTEWKYAENAQVLMHYEEAIQFEFDPKEVIDRLCKIVTEWRVKLENIKGIDEFFKGIEEIGNEKGNGFNGNMLQDLDYLSGQKENTRELNEAWKDFKSKFSDMEENIRLTLSNQVEELKDEITNLKFGKNSFGQLMVTTKVYAVEIKLKQVWKSCKPQVDQLKFCLDKLKKLLLETATKATAAVGGAISEAK